MTQELLQLEGEPIVHTQNIGRYGEASDSSVDLPPGWIPGSIGGIPMIGDATQYTNSSRKLSINNYGGTSRILS